MQYPFAVKLEEFTADRTMHGFAKLQAASREKITTLQKTYVTKQTDIITNTIDSLGM